MRRRQYIQRETSLKIENKTHKVIQKPNTDWTLTIKAKPIKSINENLKTINQTIPFQSKNSINHVWNINLLFIQQR